jgi:hypothetical protein
MNRRDFVAVLVAAGAVCAGLNTGCSKSDKPPEGSTSDAERPPAPPEPAVSSDLAPAPTPVPEDDGDTSVTPTPTPKPAKTHRPRRRKHKPPSDNPAGDGFTR